MHYHFGIIGCQHGHIATFIKQMQALGHHCVGIYDPGDTAMAEKISKRLGVPLIDDKRELLAPSVQLIGSSAINNEKIDIIEECERYGKHVMLDKPVVTNSADLQRFEQVLKRGKIKVGVMFTERYRRVMRTVKRLIEDGEIGKLVSISMRKPHRLSPQIRSAWHFSKEQNGGILIDLLIHDFDLIRWFASSEVESVQGVLGKNSMPEYPGFYDVTAAQVCMKNGVIAQLYSDWLTPDQGWSGGDGRIFVIGTTGSVEARLSGDPSIVTGEELVFLVNDHKAHERVELDSQVDNNVTRDFLERIEGRDALISANDIYEAVKWSVEADATARKMKS